MGIWDKDRENFAERQRQKAAELQAILKEREQKAQHFIDDFLIPKFRELIKMNPDSETFVIYLRNAGGNSSYYWCDPPSSGVLDYKTTETKVSFSGTTLSDAFKKLKEDYATYEISCKETSDVGSVAYDFILFLGNTR